MGGAVISLERKIKVGELNFSRSNGSYYWMG